MMIKIAGILCMTIVVLSSVCVAVPTEDQWDKLTDEALDHYYYGRKAEAIAVARKAVEAGLELFGPDDLKIVGSYDNLASYLAAAGENAEADEYYQKAFAVLQKKLPPDDHYLAIFMDYLAIFYDRIGKTDYANELRSRAKAIRFKKPEDGQHTKINPE